MTACKEMLPDCAREFGENTQQHISQNEKLDGIASSVERLGVAISVFMTGNGSPEKGVLSRITVLETERKTNWRSWDRLVTLTALAVMTATLILKNI